MFHTFYIILFTILLLPSCSCNKKQNLIPHYLLIQALLDLSILTAIKETLTPIANTIISEELNVAKNNNFAFFLPKYHSYQQLTLYYIDKIYDNNQALVLSALKDFEQAAQTIAANPFP